MSKWKVYISSTFRDLKDFRADLINLFQNQLKNNFELCEIMERMFDDGTYTPFVNDCAQAVLESDIYIIILGNRTGSFPPDEDRTYTEIELDTALANDKRIFCLRLEQFDESDIDNKTKHDELLGKFKGRPIHTFKGSLDLKNALLECLIPFASQTPVNQKNPYKGLASFNVEDGDYFFGRDAEVESCLKKIITTSGNFFVSVIGNSGTGKSSFVKAGLMFRLKTKEEYGFTKRKQILVTPASEPFTNLKYQMQLQGISVEEVLNPNSETPDIIIFFDQFEEVITQCHSSEAEEERKQLFKFLDTLASNQNTESKVLVICTFRSDFLLQLANFDFIKSHQYLFPISSLDYKVHADNWEQSMSEIISIPALINGVVLEKELVEQMLEQIKEVDGSLPILQFTLERIWNKETIADRRISSTEFNKLSEGKGISGIIETHAENVIKSITNKGQDKEREAILKTIFVNLVEVNENLNDVKRTVSKNELYSILKLYPEQVVNDVFETLVSEKSRLLSLSQDKDETINLGIIHEELIRKWERLKGWIDERREALEYKKRITLDISAFNKGEEGLYGRTQLKRARKWSQQNPDLVNYEIHNFLQSSHTRNKRQLYVQTGIPALVIAILTIVIFTWIRPAIQKHDVEGLIKKNHVELWKTIEGAGGVDAVKEIRIDNRNYSTLNGNLKFFGNLKSIYINDVDARDLSIFASLKTPSTVDTLKIVYSILNNLEGIEKLTNLKSLEIHNSELNDISAIEKLTNLTTLYIKEQKSLPNMNEIKNGTDWDSSYIKFHISKFLSNKDNKHEAVGEDYENIVIISGFSSFEDLSAIEKLTSLTSLYIIDNNFLEDLKGIGKLTNLKSLEIYNNSALNNFTGIEKLTNLTSLKIYSNSQPIELKTIEHLTNLNEVTLDSQSDIHSTLQKNNPQLSKTTILFEPPKFYVSPNQ